MRRPTENPEIFKNRRKKIMAHMGPAAMVIVSHPEHVRNHDVLHEYRQDSNMYYLTGFEEPESILVLRPGKEPESIMFVREKNVERETWDGFRFGPEGTKKEFFIDEVYTIDKFEEKSIELLKDYSEVYYRMFKNEHADRRFQKVIEKIRQQAGRSGTGMMAVKDADGFLGEFRLVKDQFELDNLKQACEISAEAHLAAMKYTKHGVSERQIQGVMSYVFYSRGSARAGYPFIIASGANATTLHYNFNDQVCKSGDLILIDAGAEYNFYTGDITRTYPVNGRFTEAQKKVYEGVLKIQKDLIASIKPGIFFKDLHEKAADQLTELMLELGLVSGRKEDVIKALQHKKYYPHGIGHWLGMDVHDAGMYAVNNTPRPITEGMCFTIEPGLYIPIDDLTAPKEFRGIGVRIEDNIVVTTTGCEVLTSKVPKEISEIEAVVGSGINLN